MWAGDPISKAKIMGRAASSIHTDEYRDMVNTEVCVL